MITEHNKRLKNYYTSKLSSFNVMKSETLGRIDF